MENELDKPLTFFRFEDLRIYHKSLDYINFIYLVGRAAHNDPVMQSFFDRFLTSAYNITIHIAEGSSRNKSQFVYYLKMAKSSVRECVVLSTVGLSRQFITKEAFDDSKQQLMEMTKMIGALIGSLQRSIKPGEHSGEEDDEDIS